MSPDGARMAALDDIAAANDRHLTWSSTGELRTAGSASSAFGGTGPSFSLKDTLLSVFGLD